MKKIFLLLAMFSVIILTSCTDSSLEDLQEKDEIQRRKQLIDKDEIENPRDKK